jgi:hypothetical protein
VSLSSRWKLASLLLALVLVTLTGCENPLPSFFARTPEVYIPAGKCAEVRKPIRVPVWTHDQDGKPVKAVYAAYAGSNVGPGVPSSSLPPAKESAIK